MQEIIERIRNWDFIQRSKKSYRIRFIVYLFIQYLLITKFVLGTILASRNMEANKQITNPKLLSSYLHFSGENNLNIIKKWIVFAARKSVLLGKSRCKIWGKAKGLQFGKNNPEWQPRLSREESREPVREGQTVQAVQTL